TDDEVTTSNQRSQFKNRRAISLPNSTIGVLEKIKATIYLSMCQYWDCPKETTLLSALLDPRYKKLKFATEAQRNMAIDKLNELYRIEQAAIIEESNDDLYVSSSGSLVTNEPLSTSTNQVNYSLLGIYEDSDDESSISDEVARYLALPKVSPNRNVLEWWKGHVNVLPVLSRLAMKYLAIPATSVPSERLFSDAGLHLSARRTCLKPELLASMLFLKRNMKLFDVFDKEEN
ncbi:16089_t:CDS:1, partial [Dentiscutata erythropus]